MKTPLVWSFAFVVMSASAAITAAEREAVWKLAPRTPWLTPAREVMNLGGPESAWKATYTRTMQGEFVKMAGAAKVYRWSDEPVDEANAKWVPVKLPQPRFEATNWRLGTGYYERRFTLTEKQAARDVLLRFEQIGVHYKVWFNGRLAVEEPQGSSFLETYDVTSFVKAGENTIRIMVNDRKGDDDSWIDWPLNHLKHGITRPFYLEFRNKVAIDKVVIRTQVEPTKVLTALVTVTNLTDRSAVRRVDAIVSIASSGRRETSADAFETKASTVEASATVNLKPGEGKVVELKKPWPEARLWSPADPHLYWMTVTLHDGAAGVRALPANQTIKQSNNQTFSLDAYRIRFGFRELRWVGTDHRALLNGKPFMMLRNTTASFGFDRGENLKVINRLRSRGIVGYRYFTGEKPDLARFCDLCDEEGFLVATAAASGWGAGFKTDAFWPRWKRMLAKMLDQCENSPSVICWGLSNEFGTVYGGKDNMANAVKQGEVGLGVQAQDPTRPWECYGEIELRWHGNEGPMPIRSCHYPAGVAGTVLPQGGRWYADGGRGWQGAFTNDKPVSVSEDLFHGFQDSHATTAKAAVGDRVYALDGYVDASWYALRSYYEGYALGGVAAWDPWCFYVEAERNGIYDGPRGSPHPNRLLMLKEHRRNLTAGAATPLTLVAVNGGFAPVKGTLAREIRLGGRTVATSEPVAVELDAGGKREFPIRVTMPEIDAMTPAQMIVTWTAPDGKAIAREAFDFMAVPPLKTSDIDIPRKVAALVTRTNAVLAGLAFPKGVHARAASALATRPAAIVLCGALLPQDAQLLDEWVKEGGRVLQLEPERTDWSVAKLPGEQSAKGFSHSFSFRRDDEHMKAIPEAAMRLWAPDGFVGAMAFPKPREDARVLWESVHSGGMQWADAAWFWRGKGGWLVSCVPATQRCGVEPVAPHFLQSLFDELVADNAVAPTRKTVLVDFGPNPADGTNAVRHVSELFAAQGAACERIEGGAAGVRALPCDDRVFVIDAKGTNLAAAAKAFVKKVTGEGGIAVVLDMARDEDPAWLGYLGIRWEKPLPVVTAPIPWNPSQTNEVDTSRRFFTHLGNAGLIAGLNNEDLFWWKPDQMWCYFRSALAGGYPTFKWQKQEGEPAHAYFESADPDTRVLTMPGAIGVKTVRRGLFRKDGTVVFATFSVSKKDYGGNHPDKVYRVVKTLLNNLGAQTAKAGSPKETFTPLDLAALATHAPFRKPGWKVKSITDEVSLDYRYFPVNQCGWSIPVQNFCPVDEFPDVPLVYDGVPFLFVDPNKNGGKSIVLSRKPGEDLVVPLGKKMKVKKLHFLGWGLWRRKPTLLRFGESAKTCEIVPDDHFGLHSGDYAHLKRGKRIYCGVWDVPPAERGTNYRPNRMQVFKWTIENPEPDTPIDRFSLTDRAGLGLHAVTVEGD